MEKIYNAVVEAWTLHCYRLVDSRIYSTLACVLIGVGGFINSLLRFNRRERKGKINRIPIWGWVVYHSLLCLGSMLGYEVIRQNQ